MLAILLTLSAARPAKAQVVLDLANVRPKIYTALGNLDIAGGGYGQYAMSVGGTTPGYYGSIDAALCRTIMGEDLLTSITEQQRTEWIAHLHSFALPDGSYTDTYGHSVLHANGQTIGALGALGGKQKYPADPLYAPFDTPSEAINYLETQIDWVNQWGAAHKFWGGLFMYSQGSRATSEWKNAVFDWLDTNVDPATGWWRIGQQPSSNTQGLGGGCHIWPIFEHCDHPFPYPERVIDRIIEMQGSSGDFGSIGNYINLDALYALRYMGSLAPSYRVVDVRNAVEEHGQWLAANLNSYLASNPGAHSLMAVVGELGLMNQLAPDLFPDSTGAVWTDIFTDPKFCRTADVEVLPEPPPDPVGADGPTPYAYTVLADRPVGYWRLGETAVGSVAEVQGNESLLGLHVGLGTDPGPGNLAQPGSRPVNGFLGMSSDNRAIHLAGQYDYVSVYDTDDLDITGSLTLEAWVRLDDIPTDNEGIVSKYVGSGNQRSFNLYVDGKNDDGTLAMIISPDGTYSNATELRDDVALPLDTWLHVVGTYDPGESMKLYIDGELVAELTAGIPESIYSSSSDLWVGCQYALSSPGCHFSGLIDEVAIYDRVLSADEILEHYSAAFSVYGDANRDGQVDELDATILATYWGTTEADWSKGDFNSDGIVNAADASILAANWHAGYGEDQLGRVHVPEPQLVVLAAVLLAVWILPRGLRVSGSQ